MRRHLGVLLIGGIALASAATAPALASVSPGPSAGGSTAHLTGAQEVPAADPDGTGQAAVSSFVSSNQVCYALKVSNVAPATAAHIHFGVAGTTGPIVVDFLPPTSGSSAGCASPRPSAPAGVIQNIINHPEQYYVNVHNAAYPGGAIRGQLG